MKYFQHFPHLCAFNCFQCFMATWSLFIKETFLWLFILQIVWLKTIHVVRTWQNVLLTFEFEDNRATTYDLTLINQGTWEWRAISWTFLERSQCRLILQVKTRSPRTIIRGRDRSGRGWKGKNLQNIIYLYKMHVCIQWSTRPLFSLEWNFVSRDFKKWDGRTLQTPRVKKVITIFGSVEWINYKH